MLSILCLSQNHIVFNFVFIFCALSVRDANNSGAHCMQSSHHHNHIMSNQQNLLLI